MIETGAKVRFIQPVIEGRVRERRLNDKGGFIEYHVDFGEGLARWFPEKDLQVLPDQEEQEAITGDDVGDASAVLQGGVQ